MSSEQFSAKPLPPSGKKLCPNCGEMTSASAKKCWLCLEKSGSGQPARHRDESAAGRQHRKAYGDEAVIAVFGILAILLCLAMAIEAPGVLLLLVVLFIPALIRTVYAMNRQQILEGTARVSSHAPSTEPNFVRTLLGSVGTVAVVGFLSFQAFWAAFFVACFPALILSGTTGSIYFFAVITIGAGTIVGLIVAVVMFRFFWSPRN